MLIFLKKTIKSVGSIAFSREGRVTGTNESIQFGLMYYEIMKGTAETKRICSVYECLIVFHISERYIFIIIVQC